MSFVAFSGRFTYFLLAPIHVAIHRSHVCVGVTGGIVHLHGFLLVPHAPGLMQLYKTFIRSNLEFSSNVWHSSLTKENRQDLEWVEKAALKVILGKDYNDYNDALKQLQLQSLEERREVISLRFVKNSLKNANFSKLFPLKKPKHVMNVRNPFKYHINKANTERYRRSTIPYLQRQLNREILKRKSEFKDLQTFNKPKRKRTEKDNHSVLVNYVSFADPIT